MSRRERRQFKYCINFSLSLNSLKRNSYTITKSTQLLGLSWWWICLRGVAFVSTHTVHSLGNSQLFSWWPWFLNMCKSCSSWVELDYNCERDCCCTRTSPLVYSAMAVTTPTYLTVLELVSCPDPVTPGTRPIWNETVLQFATATPTSIHMIYAVQNFECPYIIGWIFILTQVYIRKEKQYNE